VDGISLSSKIHIVFRSALGRSVGQKISGLSILGQVNLVIFTLGWPILANGQIIITG